MLKTVKPNVLRDNCDKSKLNAGCDSCHCNRRFCQSRECGYRHNENGVQPTNGTSRGRTATN